MGSCFDGFAKIALILSRWGNPTSHNNLQSTCYTRDNCWICYVAFTQCLHGSQVDHLAKCPNDDVTYHWPLARTCHASSWSQSEAAFAPHARSILGKTVWPTPATSLADLAHSHVVHSMVLWNRTLFLQFDCDPFPGWLYAEIIIQAIHTNPLSKLDKILSVIWFSSGVFPRICHPGSTLRVPYVVRIR